MGISQFKSQEISNLNILLLENILIKGKTNFDSIFYIYFNRMCYENIDKEKEKFKYWASSKYKSISNYITYDKEKEILFKWFKLYDYSCLNTKDKSFKEITEEIFKNLYLTKIEFFQELIINGPPFLIRHLAWKTFFKINPDLKTHYYLLLNENLDEDIKDEISKDLNRTFLNTEIHSQEHIMKLKNILHVMTLYDKKISYCQGINFIIGFLLKVCNYDEIETFNILTSILKDIRGYYLNNFPLLKLNLFIFDNLLKKFYNKVYNHFCLLEIPKELWIGKWLQTLYTINFPFDITCRIWDCLIVYGFDFILYISISIIHYMEKDLLKFKDSSDVIIYFQECFKPKEIIEISEKDIEKQTIFIDKIIHKSIKLYKKFDLNEINAIKKKYQLNNTINMLDKKSEFFSENKNSEKLSFKIKCKTNSSSNYSSNSFSNLSIHKTIKNLNFYEKSEENDNNIDEGKNDFIQTIKNHCFKNKNKQNIK